MNTTNERASHGETAEEWLAIAENMLRLTLNAAEHSTGDAKTILLRGADELNHKIQDATTELAGRTGGHPSMNDAMRTRIAHISSNYIRAQQAEGEGDDRASLRHLLFAAQDITQVLGGWQENQIDDAMAASYADSLVHTASTIKGLIAKGVKPV